MSQFKPMLAEDVVDYAELRYPLWGSFKIDGVRGVMPINNDGPTRLKPRSLKEFGNRATVEYFSQFSAELKQFDGELTLGPDPAAPALCRLTTSALASHAGQPEIHWWVFDLIDCEYPADGLRFEDRYLLLRKLVAKLSKKVAPYVHLVEQRLLRASSEAETMEHEALARGYEGLVLKDPAGQYKFGRSTLRSQQFLRAKRFADAEGKVLEVHRRLKNNNAPTRNALGHQVRSSHKANKVELDTVGSFLIEVVTGPFKGVRVEVGTGWDAELGKQMWAKAPLLLGKLLKFSYFPHGCKDKPRFPVFLGFRDEVDLSN